MSVAVGTRTIRFGSVVAIVGGVLAVVGAILAWETIDPNIATLAGSPTSKLGFDFFGGKIILACGVLGVVFALLDLTQVEIPVSVPMALLSLGGIATAVGVLNYASVSLDVSDGNALIPNLVAVGTGLYVSVLGAVVILAAGGLAWMTRKG